MAQITSFGEIEADGSILNDNNSRDFSVTKTGTTFHIVFRQDVSKAIIVASGRSTENFDPGVVALVERGANAQTVDVSVVLAGNGAALNDRGFWFMALNNRFDFEEKKY